MNKFKLTKWLSVLRQWLRELLKQFACKCDVVELSLIGRALSVLLKPQIWVFSSCLRPADRPTEVVLGGNQYEKLMWAWRPVCNSSPSALDDSSYLFNSISLPARSRPPGYIGVFHLAGVRLNALLHTLSLRIDGAGTSLSLVSH